MYTDLLSIKKQAKVRQRLYFRLKVLSVIVLLCGFKISSNAQENDSRWDFEPAIGIGVRSTPMYFFNFDFIERYSIVIQDYNWERNLQGLSLQPSFKISPKSSTWSVQLIAGFRYDYIYDKFVRWDTLNNPLWSPPQFIRGIDKQVKEFIFEPQISLLKKVSPNTSIGIGYTLVNTRKTYRNFDGVKVDIEFHTIDFVFQRERPKIFWEIKANYIPKGQFPRDPFQDFIMYSARIAYKISTSKRKK